MSSDAHTEEIDAYEKDLIDNLTLNDALVLVAVCAAKEKAGSHGLGTEDARQIAAAAREHPVFDGCKESIEPSINKLSNLVSTKIDLSHMVQAAAGVLTPELRETAFDWVSIVIKSEGDLSGEHQLLLDHYSRVLKQVKHG
jgi:hypothetical protein